MKYIALFFVLVIGGSTNLLFAQNDSLQQLQSDEAQLKLGMDDFDDQARGTSALRVVFYNVENLFDTQDDSLTRDDEFTPTGNKGWSYRRYREKLHNIYKTMTAVGGWEPPAIMGFCEIENRKVLEDIIRETPFRRLGYEIVHEESPDRRGIDVGLVYNPAKFKLLHHQAIRMNFPFDKELRTRDVLHVVGETLNRDTLHVFVNHWPSRWGGQVKSEPKRIFVASQVRAQVDSILQANADANIIIMGDLNDEPDNKSVLETLGAKGDKDALKEGDLYNYMHPMQNNWKLGSHKYRDHWGILDQIIVSQGLLKEKGLGLEASPAGAKIFAARFLLEPDMRNFGLKPFRTYGGPRFLGGFSDHLPIFIDLELQRPAK